MKDAKKKTRVTLFLTQREMYYLACFLTGHRNQIKGKLDDRAIKQLLLKMGPRLYFDYLDVLSSVQDDEKVKKEIAILKEAISKMEVKRNPFSVLIDIVQTVSDEMPAKTKIELIRRLRKKFKSK